MKMKIKYFSILVVVAIVAAMTFQSCSDKDSPILPDEPEYDVYTFNRNDSSVFCDVFKKAYIGYESDMCSRYGVKLDDIWTWHEFCQWVLDESTKEARIYSLDIHADDTEFFPGYVSSRILELDSLRDLRISGRGICGTLPVHPNGNGRLARLAIWSTRMLSIPDDVFKYPYLSEMWLLENYEMEFPKAVFNMENQKRAINAEYPTVFRFMDNGFKGVMPMNVNQFIDLDGNEFSEVDWTGMDTVNYKEKYKVRFSPGVNLLNNPIKTKIPDYIVADTLALLYVSNHFGGRGSCIENLPTLEEMSDMKKEWRKNHPDEVEELPYF